MGTKPAAALVTSFDGLGVGFQGPHGNPLGRNPSDNSLAVGPDHVFQIVNTRLAIFDKQGKTLYGSVPTNTLFKGFGGTCEERNNGDAVVRYDQIANRWLVIMPIFRRAKERADQPPVWTAREQAWEAPPGVANQPGAAMRLFVPPPAPPEAPAPQAATPAPATPPTAQPRPPQEKGPYSMCYAISTSPDPLGTWYRYEFLRPLFPDYPRPAIWPDGYYVPTSTGDEVIEKHACIVERDKMLKGEPAREQCLVINDVNFLNNADVHGTRMPAAGAPNIMMAAGGTQLKGDLDDDGIYVWKVKVDWSDSSKTRAAGPEKIAVAPYEYLCGGQLTNCVPQPGTDRRLDAQGDKIMSQLVYRHLGDRQSIVAVHSVNTAAGGGGVRWYEFDVDGAGQVSLRQQGTYAPDGFYRWMASPAIDKFGNIGIGYSFGGTPHFAGQRFAARLANDPLGVLTMRENVLVDGEEAQTNTLRWEDYTQTAIDPVDDCTIWYVGDYVKKGASSYSTKIGAFRLPGCEAQAELEPTAHVFASPGGTDLKAHVFSPAGEPRTALRPAIVIFHGGGWAEGDAEWAFPRARHFAARGMVAVAAQYRLSNGKGITPIEAMADARAVIRWMRAESKALGIDPSKIAAYGWSAGAHLAASAALFEDDGDEGAGVSSRPDALALSSPAVAIEADSWFQELLGDRGKVRDLSPDEHVREGMPPTVIVQGDVDTVTPLAGVTRFCDRMKDAGNTCELHVFKGFGHLFTPAGMRDDRQPAPDRAVAAEAMDRVDRFLKALGFQR